jgi:hypothetical protein
MDGKGHRINADYNLKIDGKNEDGDIEIVSDDSGECLVATVDADNCDDPKTAEADAERIVESWNAHDGLVEVLEAAEGLLANARDTGECFVDRDHEKYDPNNPEQMWNDWSALQDTIDKVRTGRRKSPEK